LGGATPTYITLTLPDEYKKAKYKNVFAAYITPIIATHKGTRGKCVTADGFTECEWAFASAPAAKAAARALNALFKRLEKESPSLLRTTGATSLPAKAAVMPATYERTGARNIVRPDYHTEGLKAKACRGFDAPLKAALRDGETPPLPATDYCGVRVRGNDGKMWVSAGKGTKCVWTRV
jgi:hypothetical protein